MKNNLKKLFIVLTVVLFSLTSNVEAATTITVDSTKMGTVDTASSLVTNTEDLVISQVNAEDTFAAYKILDVFYNASTNTITYEFTSDFQNFLDNSSTYNGLTVEQYQAKASGDITSGNVQTPGDDTLDKLTSAYASYIQENNLTGIQLTVAGTTATLNAAAGSYLVLPTATTKIYAVMVGNIEFSADSTDNTLWQLNSTSIVAKKTEAYVDKTVGNTTNSEASYNIGDSFTYYIKAAIPKYPTNATNRTYVIKDTLDSGLTFKGIDTVVVQDGATELTVTVNNMTRAMNETGLITDSSNNQVGTITATDQELVFTIDTNYVNSDKLLISYDVELNNQAVHGSAGNKSSVSLTYSNDPYGTANNTTADVDTTVYTYGFQITVVDSTDQSKKLQGAEYSVYSDSELTNKVTEIVTDAAGIASVVGLEEGTYYLKQTKAPTNYRLSNEEIIIEITSTEAGTTGIVNRTITNTGMGILPATGGIGTVMFTILGSLGMLGGIWFFFIYKKRDKKQEA